MSSTVTVGLDGSREGLAAANWAAREALSRGLPLRLLAAWDSDHDNRSRRIGLDTARGWGERSLHITQHRLQRRHPGLHVETTWIPGDPVDTLSTAGNEAELLVLGSRGLSGIAGFLAGSVSLAVLARIRRPAVLVHPQTAPVPQEHDPAGYILLGLDASRPSDEMLAFTFDTADRYSCRVRVLYSWAMPLLHGPDMAGALPLLTAELENDWGQALDAALTPWTKKYPAVPVVRQCQQGRPAQDLIDAAHRARLVVVGRRNRRSRIGTHIGAVTHAVLHHSPTPVAVVPHD
ncbi:universal stress protein [Streptomyces sp. NPDC006208]|uniref:universal stress protein n=1 Tax=Streptomyces sp. NPDC006208 TaxID=3156734 RepID=UPI0033BF8F19